MRIFLACTPRTGNLWIRRIIGQVLNLQQFTGHNPDEVYWDLLPEDCLVAMHWHHTRELSDFIRDQGFQIVVTTRHPLDVLVSILRFASLEPLTARWLEGEGGDESQLVKAVPDSDEFASYCLSRRAEALLGISQEWHDDADVIVRYEDFLREPAEATRRIVHTLRAEPIVDIDEAVRANTMDKLRSLASRHIWRGHAGDWKRVVTPPLAQGIRARHQPPFSDFGYVCDPDPALDAEKSRRNWEEMLLCG
jgi:hypothetical protein